MIELAPDGGEGLEVERARRERRLASFVVVAPAVAVAAAIGLGVAGEWPTRFDLTVFAIGGVLTMIGVELGYHRYFTHRAFDAHPAFAWLLGALGSSAFLGPVIWWSAIHRRHHADTDREGDPHSPNWPHRGLRGLVHGHIGWLFDPAFTAMSLSAGKMRDLWSNRVAVTSQRLYLVWGVAGLAIPTLLGAIVGGARGAAMGLLWGGFARVFVVSHGVWAINSVGHRLGRPRNNVALVVPTVGGGFHANHHDAPRAYTTSAAWWQLDLGGALLWLLARARVVTNLKTRRQS